MLLHPHAEQDVDSNASNDTSSSPWPLGIARARRRQSTSGSTGRLSEVETGTRETRVSR
jgi:hypothetical protein